MTTTPSSGHRFTADCIAFPGGDKRGQSYPMFMGAEANVG
jgi:hypothetical protein